MPWVGWDKGLIRQTWQIPLAHAPGKEVNLTDQVIGPLRGSTQLLKVERHST